MRVKDVERLTGLSTKAIRLYEEKGLISVGDYLVTWWKNRDKVCKKNLN
ncbi:TPA: MerR family DNA-binding transcriptional regulator [Streptococcus suis]